MGMYRSFAGMVRVRLLAPDGPECLQALEREHISAFSIRIADAVTQELTVSRKDLKMLRNLCKRKGYSLEIIRRSGMFWPLFAMLERPVLIIGLVFLFVAACFIPGRILFIGIEGNVSVPSRYILEQAESCGLKFMSRRRDIRSEQVKNGLLEAVSQLQWVGVNTYGCRAVITVRERTDGASAETAYPVCHIAAARDGIIRSCTVTSGHGNCAIGQAVKTGDILISGYTDCGLTCIAERAGGKVLAQTQREICIRTPVTCQFQSAADRTDSKFALLLGKKRINFYKGSGISGATCDKMYSKYVLTLPGGFELPVALLKEYTVECNLTEVEASDPEAMLKRFAEDYLMDLMSEGAIERKSETVTKSDGFFQLSGTYACLENIGIVQEEKIGEFNGKTDGTDRERGPGG